MGDEERVLATLVSFVRARDDVGSSGQCETACIHQPAAACKVHVWCWAGVGLGQLHLSSTGCYDDGALPVCVLLLGSVASSKHVAA